MTDGTGTIYNSTDGPLPYDRAGRMLEARGRLRVRDVEASPIAGHVKASRFLVVASRDDDPVAPALEDEDAEAPDSATEDEGSADVAEPVDEATPDEPAPAPATPPATPRRGRKAAASPQEG